MLDWEGRREASISGDSDSDRHKNAPAVRFVRSSGWVLFDGIPIGVTMVQRIAKDITYSYSYHLNVVAIEIEA